jgi:hypothetical protein
MGKFDLEKALQLKERQDQEEAERNRRRGEGIAGYALHQAARGHIGEYVLSRASQRRFRFLPRSIVSTLYPDAAYAAANSILSEHGLTVIPPGGIEADFNAYMRIERLECPEPTSQVAVAEA